MTPFVDLGIPGYDHAEEIGRGGFATVYRARRQRFGDYVAIKLIDTVPDERALRRVDRELHAVGRVAGHRNLVAVYDANRRELDGRPYIVMELIPGGTLAQMLTRSGPLPWADVVDIGIVLAAALQWAHDREVIHRDVKPENVLIDDRFTDVRDRIRLSDFGIAAIVGRTVTSEAWSIAHAAPEVILHGAAPSTKGDVYGLASTLYQLLDGEPPFVREDDDTLGQVFARMEAGTLGDLREKGVPPAVAAAIERSLQSDPDRRPHTAAEFAALLVEAASNLGAGNAVPGTREIVPPVRLRAEADQTVDPSPPSATTPRTGAPRRLLALLAVVLILAGVLTFRTLSSGDTDRPTESSAASGSGPTTTETTSPAPSSSSTTSTTASVPLTTFRDAGAGFTVDYPQAWRKVDVATADYRLAVDGGSNVAFTIRVVTTQVPATTTNIDNFKAVTDGLVASNSTVRVLSQEPVTMNGMLGFYYFYTFTDRGTDAVHAHYFLFSGRKMNIIVFQTPPGDFERLAPTFDRIADSFRSDPEVVPTTTAR